MCDLDELAHVAVAGLLDGRQFRQTSYALDRDSRKAALARFLSKAAGDRTVQDNEEIPLDAERHRYDQALSDISGQDIESHNNDPDAAIRCVRNWLSEHRPGNADPLPGAAAMQADYRQYQAEVGALIAHRRLDPDDLTHSDYLYLVRGWLQLRGAAA